MKTLTLCLACSAPRFLGVGKLFLSRRYLSSVDMRGAVVGFFVNDGVRTLTPGAARLDGQHGKKIEKYLNL